MPGKTSKSKTTSTKKMTQLSKSKTVKPSKQQEQPKNSNLKRAIEEKEKKRQSLKAAKPKPSKQNTISKQIDTGSSESEADENEEVSKTFHFSQI